MTQQEALDILKTGANVFLTGAAGSGKTHLLREYIAYLDGHGATVGITASTGIAATHMGGMTIHSWSGIGIHDSLSKGELDALSEKSYLSRRLKAADVLIIDEVSMLHDFRFDLVGSVLRAIRRSEIPFGGLQVVISGDFFQLPPVSREGEARGRFAYHADAWPELDLKVCYLEEQHRQDDPALLGVLNAIRDNDVSEETGEILRSRFGTNAPDKIPPTKLYTHNVDVDAENDRELTKLPGRAVEYKMESKGAAALVSALKKGCLAPELLSLKKEARVMFVKNNFEDGYVNGTLGIVLECTPAGITVRTSRGKKVRVPLADWHIEEDGRMKAEIIQYPLRLAWAITVHKSQGISLDAAEIDLSRSFEPGMGYVALSRVRSLGGLFLRGLNATALKVHDEVLEYDEVFRRASVRHAADIRSMSSAALAKQHEAFLERVRPPLGASRGKKKKKLDTLTETQNLIALRSLMIKDIAYARDITEETVLSHIERLRERDPALDISHLKNSISADRFDEIASVFKRIGKDARGGYLLAPVHSALGEGYSYADIRLVRLFL